MALTSGDIKLFFSGGSANNDPDQSLGGDISSYYIPSNRLFDNVSGTQSLSGYVDYRCIYFNNISSTDTLYNAGVFVSNEVAGGSTVSIGIEVNNERQDIYITNAASVATGSIIMQFYDFFTDTETQFTVVHSPTISTWASNFQTAIRAISGLEDVTVSGSFLGTTAYFSVNFLGTSAKRYFETLELVSLSQEFLDVSATLSIQKISDGGPKLKTANQIASEIIPPTNVVFVSTSYSSTLSIGDLKPSEYFPVWIKRTVSGNTIAIDNDGFTIRLKGEIL